MNPAHRQHAYRERLEWGLRGADAIAADADIAVVVDVLSFTTTVSVALDRGIQVVPHRWSDAEAVARHLEALTEVDPQLAQAYRANSLRTAQRAHAPDEVFAVLGDVR